MKRLISPLFFALFILTSALFAQGTDTKSDDIDLIENSIIVNGLSLTSDKKQEDDQNENGDVIFDDNFSDDITTRKIISSHSKVKSTKENDATDIMNDLHRADRRWHYSRYTIKKGDSLWSIVRQFNSSHRLIIRVNRMTKNDALRPGKKILVPNRNGIEYKIRSGDSLFSLARKYKTDTAKLLACNTGSGKTLKAGTVLFIPDAVLPPKKRILIEKDTRMIAVKKSPAVEETQPVKEKAPEQAVVTNDQPKPVQKITQVSFAWPLQGRITSGFGSRIDPFSRDRRFHNGIDISAETGTPVHAACDGTVIFSGWKDGYGNLVVVKHENGYVSVYGHNSELKKKEGDAVSKGEIISLSGMTGAVTGAHLHFEIQKYGTPLNPLRLLK